MIKSRINNIISILTQQSDNQIQTKLQILFSQSNPQKLIKQQKMKSTTSCQKWVPKKQPQMPTLGQQKIQQKSMIFPTPSAHISHCFPHSKNANPSSTSHVNSQTHANTGTHTHNDSVKKTANSFFSKKQSAKNSTAKYREKKKKQLNFLEQNVKDLQNQLIKTQNQIQETKQNIMNTLQMLAKINQRTSNDNIQIYNQLEALVGKSNHISDNNTAKLNQESPQTPYAIDIDKINLLLDTLKYRIGASGRQRQSKLTYQFKSIVNTLFPALYRYILFACLNKIDVFSPSSGFTASSSNSAPKPSQWQWTNQLLLSLSISEPQIHQLLEYQPRLLKVYQETTQGIIHLNNLKQKLKAQGIKIQAIEQQYREVLMPEQCANWILFVEKYKYRREMLLEFTGWESRDTRIGRENMKQEQIVKAQEKYGIGQDQDQIIRRGLNGRKRTKITKQYLIFLHIYFHIYCPFICSFSFKLSISLGPVFPFLLPRPLPPIGILLLLQSLHIQVS